MDELIEQMAEAICDSSNAGSLFPWASLDETYREQWLVMTLAALGVIAAHPKFELVELSEPDYKHIDSDLACERGSEWGTESGPLRAFEDGHVEWDGDRSSVEVFRRTAANFLAAAKAAEGRKGGSDE